MGWAGTVWGEGSPLSCLPLLLPALWMGRPESKWDHSCISWHPERQEVLRRRAGGTPVACSMPSCGLLSCSVSKCNPRRPKCKPFLCGSLSLSSRSQPALAGKGLVLVRGWGLAKVEEDKQRHHCTGRGADGSGCWQLLSIGLQARIRYVLLLPLSVYTLGCSPCSPSDSGFVSS